MMSIDTNDEKSRKKVGLIYNEIIKDKDEIFIEKLLQTEGDINYKLPQISTEVPNLLHVALLKKHNFFNLLLEHGADFTYKDEKGRTVVHALIEYQLSNVNQSTGRINSVLAAQVKSNNFSNPSDKNGITHFHAACMTNDATAVEFFLKHGVDVNEVVKADSPMYPSYTPLHFAVDYTCPNAVEILLKHGANVYLKNAAGLSPLNLIIKKKAENFQADAIYERMLGIFAKCTIDGDVNRINATDDFGFCKFHAACIHDDESLVEGIIERIANINQTVNFDSTICPGYTALHFATFSNVQIFKLLLNNEADIDAKNARGETPFDLVMQNYSIEDIHSVLLTKPEWRSIVLSDDQTKLIDVVSAMKSKIDLASLLKDTRSISKLSVPLDSPLWPGYTLLHLAVIASKKHDFAIIDACLKRGAVMTIKDAKGSTALHLAFYLQKSEVVKYLLDHYSKSDNPVDEYNLSHFHIACAACHLNTVKRFLSKFFIKVDVNSQVLSTFERREFYRNDMSFSVHPGSTALHISTAIGNPAMTKLLLKHGADVNVQDANGFTPVHRLLFYGGICFIDDLLLSAKNLKNVTTTCGLSHLHVACYFKHVNAIKKLLKLGADINEPLNDNWIVNVKEFDEYFSRTDPYVRTLLSNYAGNTPLHFSQCGGGSFETALVLIEQNANVFATDAKGTSAMINLLNSIDYCSSKAIEGQPYSRNYNECYEVFSKNIAISTYLEDELGITKLHLACCLADVKLVQNLIKHGANVNVKVNPRCPIWRGYTPLHCVVIRAFEKCRENNFVDNLEKIVRLLVDHGADVLSMNDNGDTPFHLIKLLYDPYCKFEDTFESVVFPFFPILFDNMKSFNVNPTDKQGLSVFHVACITLNVAVIENFLKHSVDVNQSISYYSKVCPGSTPLHLLIRHYRRLKSLSSKFGFSDEAFLQIVNILLDKSDNVDAVDVFDNTPLLEAVHLSGIRQILIGKIISRGADVHATNRAGNTALEMLLMGKDVTWEEVDYFVNAGCNFNAYHPISQEGYIAILLRYYLEIDSSCTMIENRLLRIIDNPKIIEVNNAGRTAIHNLVSVHFSEGPMIRLNLWKNVETLQDCYTRLIKRLVIRGCDIDHQDNEGKTALHLAVTFGNLRAIVQLLKNGADVNIINKRGKTAFTYCCNDMLTTRVWNNSEEYFTKHVYKLEFSKQRVIEQNKRLRDEVLNKFGARLFNEFDYFHEEMAKSMNIQIGNTSISLYEFLMGRDMDIVYKNMTSEDRRDVDQFVENIEKHNFCEIDCLVKLKYRTTIERTKMVELALTSLNVLANYHLPELISEIVFNFLTNEDLKRLIASIN